MPASPETWTHVGRNLATIRSRIADVAAAAGRDPADVQLVAVSKTFPVEAITAALEAGQTVFGENRIQEALPKIETLAAATPATDALSGRDPSQRPQFHFIGHLQTNKAKQAGAFDMIESVDSVRLAAALDQRLPHPIPVLLEINVSGEASKHGLASADLTDALAAIGGPADGPMAKLEVAGLMTVAPLVADPEDARAVFRELRRLRDTHQDRHPGLRHLSMGMTNDYAVAIDEGATIVRIGRAIFGDR